MAARSTGLIAAAAVIVALGAGAAIPAARAGRSTAHLETGAVAGAAGPGAQSRATLPRRIISLVPALTEVLFAIGAGPQVVAVGSFDNFPPEVKGLPRVGALLDPDTERILSLRPDLVAIYGSQTDLQQQFARARVPTYVYRHGGITTILETISELGAATGHEKEAARLTSDLRSRLDAVRERVRGRPRPRVLLVFERQPRTLREIYASGGRGFLHEMLEIAGGVNVFADSARESVQPSLETILTRAPEVILEVRAEGRLEPGALAGERDVWSAVASVPAVRNGRIRFLSGDYLVVPGPRFARATEELARAIHPDAFR